MPALANINCRYRHCDRCCQSLCWQPPEDIGYRIGVWINNTYSYALLEVLQNKVHHESRFSGTCLGGCSFDNLFPCKFKTGNVFCIWKFIVHCYNISSIRSGAGVMSNLLANSCASALLTLSTM